METKTVTVKIRCNSIEEFAHGTKTAKLDVCIGEGFDSYLYGHIEVSLNKHDEADNFLKLGQKYLLHFSKID